MMAMFEDRTMDRHDRGLGLGVSFEHHDKTMFRISRPKLNKRSLGAGHRAVRSVRINLVSLHAPVIGRPAFYRGSRHRTGSRLRARGWTAHISTQSGLERRLIPLTRYEAFLGASPDATRPHGVRTSADLGRTRGPCDRRVQVDQADPDAR